MDFDFVISRLYDGPQIYRDLAARETIRELVTAILGPGCEIVGLNVI